MHKPVRPSWSTRAQRRLLIAMVMGTLAIVLLAIIAIGPPFWTMWRERAIEGALRNGTEPTFWWPYSWRDRYNYRKYETLELHSTSMTLAALDAVALFRNEWQADRSEPDSGVVEDSRDSSRLAVIRDAPDFELTDQDGQTLRMSDLRGKVTVVSFIFTTCNGSCPATTHRMSLVQRELQVRGVLGNDRVRLLSITLDPARDTPEVLARYMRLYDVDRERWSFLTGPAEQVKKTIAAWGMWVRPAADGQLDHPSRIFLVDPKGRVREIYNLDFLKPQWAAEDVQLLLDEGG